MNRFARFAVVVAALVAVPTFGQRGTADFTRFVALGDSYGAGVVDNSLNIRHQPWSWPAIVARQAGVPDCPPNALATDFCFAQPLVSYPGIGPELELMSLIPAPVIAPAPGLGQPLMLNFARPYNNLSVPGATLGALLTVTGAEPQQANEPTVVTMGRFILRGLGTQVQQAVAQQPTMIAVWIGGNDYLNVAFSGTTATLTPVDQFRARYEAMLDGLIAGAPGAGIVAGNLPAIVPPYLTLVPTVLVDPATRQPVLISGQPVVLEAELGDGVIGPVPPGTLIPLHVREKIALGFGLPQWIGAIPPFKELFPRFGEPLSANDIITPDELQAVFARVDEYNKVIQEEAAAREIPVADIRGLFNRVRTDPATGAGGLQLGPIVVSDAYITGGFFSLDGFHLTDLGYLLFANEYIRAINSAYGTRIPVASIAQLFANNGAFFPDVEPTSFATSNAGITDAAVRAIVSMWAQRTMRRGRAVGR